VDGRPTILVTGGAGFIGSALIRRILATTSAAVVNVDKLTYAGNLESLAEAADHPLYRFERVDICDGPALRQVFESHRPSHVVHLAAESHVDRSIDAPAAFIETNVVGTFRLLEESRRHWTSLRGPARDAFRFVHISTDEVFGSLENGGTFSEASRYAPNSPYSATKAGSDHLVRAWHHTFGLPVITTNCSNNFGPWQFPEKLIPTAILSAAAGQSVPVYGTGDNVRDWLYVDDHAAAILAALEAGRIGETYLVGGLNPQSNLQVVTMICDLVDEALTGTGGRRRELIRFVPDRPGHDQRYAIDSSKIQRELGWRPAGSFGSALRDTVGWYLGHTEWCARVQGPQDRGRRLGLGSGT
jgi:dTDP-glucose 4,6-dehydratase